VQVPDDRDQQGPSRGWHLAGGLALLAVVMLAMLWLLPDPAPTAKPSVGMHPAILAPWSVCARAVVSQLGRGVQIVGPNRIAWDDSGRIADVLGVAAAHGGQADRPFACRAVRLDSQWQVERLTFAP
jgi:hypothetical protein